MTEVKIKTSLNSDNDLVRKFSYPNFLLTEILKTV